MSPIYAEANAYADDVGGVERGMNILYTPLMLRPRLMVVSTQGAGDELMGLMAPDVILTYGSPPFEALTGERKARGKFAEAAYRGISVVGCSHYSRNVATPEGRRAVMARIRELSGG